MSLKSEVFAYAVKDSVEAYPSVLKLLTVASYVLYSAGTSFR